MKKNKLPIVDANCLFLEDGDLIIRVGSDKWYAWLLGSKSFKFIPVQQGWTLNYSITVTKRKNNGLWYAYRRVNNKLRQAYLGKSECLDFDTLQDTAARLSLDDIEYWKMKKVERKKIMRK